MMYPNLDGTEPCRQTDPELFFPPIGANKKQIEVAKAICARCHIQSECLDYALGIRLAGVWGGHTNLERRRIANKRRIAQREITTVIEEPSEQLTA